MKIVGAIATLAVAAWLCAVLSDPGRAFPLLPRLSEQKARLSEGGSVSIGAPLDGGIYELYGEAGSFINLNTAAGVCKYQFATRPARTDHPQLHRASSSRQQP